MDASYDDKFIRSLDEDNLTLKVNYKPCSGCVSNTIRWVENWDYLNEFISFANFYRNFINLTIDKSSPKRHFEPFIK